MNILSSQDISHELAVPFWTAVKIASLLLQYDRSLGSCFLLAFHQPCLCRLLALSRSIIRKYHITNTSAFQTVGPTIDT